jgi:hypothetical protein
MTKISDQMKGNARPTSTVSTPEGGGDMALALTSTVQAQANQLAIAADAANISIGHASDELSDYFAGVMGGTELINQTLAKTMAKIEQRGGPVTIETEVKPITINLPESRDFAQTRRGFLGMFGAAPTEQNPFLVAAATAADEVASDD